MSACIALLNSVGEVVERWDWLADPGIEIPPGAAAVHGITTERARRDGQPASAVVTEITERLRAVVAAGWPVVVYNAPYDFSVLDRECRRHGIETLASPFVVIDPLVIDKAMDRYRKGKRTLVATSAVYGVPLESAHDAGADAIAAGRLAQSLLTAYPKELDIALDELHILQRGWYSDQAASFEEYIRRVKGDERFVSDRSWPVRPRA